MKTKKLLIFANDPLHEYYKKGELIDRYFNPCDFFDEIYFVSLSKKDIEDDKIQHAVGKARVRIFPVGEMGPRVFFSISELRKKILEIAREFQPNCIRAYNAHVQGFLGASLSREMNIPLVISLHINPEKDVRAFLSPFVHPSKWFFWKLCRYVIEPFVLCRADKVICAYDFIHEFAKNLCKDQTKIEIIYNRIDMDRFKPIESSAKKNNSIKILSVGRLFERKNPEYLIKAMLNIDAELVIIGNGAYRSRLQRIIETMGLTRKVSIISSVPNQEIHRYYQQSDIFVSVNDYGGISKVVIEAMAAGLPIVVNRPLWESAPELLGNAAIVVENSSAGFVKALNNLITFPSLRSDLGDINRKKALEISGSIMEQKEKTLYMQLLSNG